MMLCSAVAEMFCFLFTDIVRPAGFIQWSASDPRTSTFTSSLYLEPFRLPSKFEADSRTVFPLPVPNVTHFIEAGSYGPGWDAAARANNSAVDRPRHHRCARAVLARKDLWRGDALVDRPGSPLIGPGVWLQEEKVGVKVARLWLRL
jgi:hypothetical protein